MCTYSDPPAKAAIFCGAAIVSHTGHAR
jgi:hypothetical protein